MSSSGGIGSTLTGGIQDIAGILPLLGTEQCSVQVSSALSRGYLYAAATPMSIFGSLGVVSAGVQTLVACFSFRGIEGAKILGNMGFEPQGENLSLIMVETGKGVTAGTYIIETRIKKLIKELNIDESRITGVSHKSAAWNVKMIAATALLCAVSIAPYIYLNQLPNDLTNSTIWVFPVLRATGGFMTTTLIQLLIQQRIATLFNQYLVKQDQQPNKDVEAAVTKKHPSQMDARTWLLLFLLLIGLVASVAGYVGSFSVVQNSATTIGPLSWLCLESGLSVMRLAIWAWNPTSDDAPPLEIILELDEYEHKPLPTCNKDNEEILRCKVLPLTRAEDFLKIITSFAGPIEPFSNPDLSLYYTLTRKRPSKESADVDNESENAEEDAEDNESEDAENHKLGERILYITVFDHKERTTRVYTGVKEKDTFYSTKTAPIINVGHFLLEVEIDTKINDLKGDPVSSNIDILNSLRKHHRSILEHIQYRLGVGDVTKQYPIENSWTMKVEDTISTLKRLRKENGDNWKKTVEKGREEERNEGRNEESLLIFDYFMHSTIEGDRRLLDEKRVEWIARRMETITEETKEMFEGEMDLEHRVNKQIVERMPATKSPEEMAHLILWEKRMMGLLLLYEVKEWELLFWNKFKAFLDRIGIGRVGEKERMEREWKADCRKRLNTQMDAAEELLDYPVRDKNWVRDDNLSFNQLLKIQGFHKRWTSSVWQHFEGAENSNSISLSDLREELEYLDYDIRLRMEKEIEDTEFRLKRGSDLGRFDQFWDEEYLFKCRYSRSKWLYLIQDGSTAPPEVYWHALKGNKNIINLTFASYDSDSVVNGFQDIICDLPWVTSITFERPTTIHRDLLFIQSTDNDLVTFAKEIRPKLDPLSTYIFMDTGNSSMWIANQLGNNARVLISFVAPTSSRLKLRLKHSGSEDGPLEVTLGSTIIQLNPSLASSFTIDDITLDPIPGPEESDHLLFEPGIRNEIVVQFRGTVHGHFLHGIELLDEADQEYRPYLASLSTLSN